MKILHQQASDALRDQRSQLVEQMVDREFVRHPQLEQCYGHTVRARMLEDTGYHLDYLAQAIASDNETLFLDYIGWAKVMLTKRGVPAHYLATMLESMTEAVQAALPPTFSGLACDYLDRTRQKLPHMPDEVASFITDDMPLAQPYLEALLRGDRNSASQLILDAVAHGTPVQEIYLRVFEPTQHEIGRLWQLNKISVAQEHYCTAATQQIMAQLYPQVFSEEKTRGTLVTTCVSGDLHEVGARMVCDFFELDGWQTHYLGANVPTASVVQFLVEHQATVLAISATITPHVRAVEKLITAVRRTLECSGIKIIVGGYPFNVAPHLWSQIGADGSAVDAQGAVNLANLLTRSPDSPSAAALCKVVPTMPGPASQRREDHFYEGLSRTNNELVNLQREMARRNAELAAAQEKLAASEQRYRSLSACSPIGILEMDATGRCLYANPRWQAVTGLTADDSLGEGWQYVLDPIENSVGLTELQQALRTGQEFSREFCLVTASGDKCWVQLHTQPIPATNGALAGHVCTVEDITGRKHAEAALAQAHRELVDLARRAGMAEIATNVLHNVGNVLTSVNVSACLVVENLRKSKIDNLAKAAALLREHEIDLGDYLTSDPKGRQLPRYLTRLAEHLAGEQATAVNELAQLQKNVEHIKVIVNMQQSFTKVSGLAESLQVSDLVEDALRMNASSFARHNITVMKDFDPVPSVVVEKHKVLQILVNLLSNARHACDESGRKDKELTLRLSSDAEHVRLAVTDNGIGIPPENLTRIFGHGFTTKKSGHGFGLHSAALAAREMGGTLNVHSDGSGHGASFTLELPCAAPESPPD